MRENDYTGSPVEDGDELSDIENLGLYEFDADDIPDALSADEDNETLIHVGSAANGAKTLQEAAEMLYDFADELLALSADNWEIVDDIANGHGTAVRFDVEGDADLGLDDE